MVNYHLRNLGLNEKVVLEKRNKRLIELLSLPTDHNSLKQKFEWILEQLKNDYPNLKIGAVKFFYYNTYKKFNSKSVHFFYDPAYIWTVNN
jgi:hypothetical protein